MAPTPTDWKQKLKDALNTVVDSNTYRQIEELFRSLGAPPVVMTALLGIATLKGIQVAGAAGVAAAGTVLQAGVTYYTGLDEEMASVRRATGNFMNFDVAVDKAGKSQSAFVGNVIAVQKETALLGSTTAKVTEGIKELYTSSRIVGKLFTDNTGAAQEQIRAYSKLAIQLDALGISNKSYAETVDVVGKTYRMTDVLGTTEELGLHFVNLQRATGISAETISADFGAAVKDLAAYSYPEMLRVFSGLEAQVAATGVSMSTLLSVTKKFDTFESAATAVGDLNAMLGGPYLNTLDMINATEEERIALLQDMMAQGGKTWETMGRFERKAIAEALGTSVQEAARLMQGTRDEMDDITVSAADNALSLEKLLGITEKGLGKARDGAAANAVSLRSQLEGLTAASLGILNIYEKIRDAQQSIFVPWSANMERINNATEAAIGKIFTLGGRVMGPLWEVLKTKLGEVGIDVEEILNPPEGATPTTPRAPARSRPPQITRAENPRGPGPALPLVQQASK